MRLKLVILNGITITGSHNPKDDNGLKMVINDNAISGIEIKESVENLGEIPTSDIAMVENLDLKRNTEEVMNKVKTNKKLKVVLDAGNGAAGILAEEMFTALGHEVISINKEPMEISLIITQIQVKKNLIEIKKEIDQQMLI